MPANVCRGHVDCWIDGYDVTIEGDADGNFVLYLGDRYCRKPKACDAKRYMYYVLHQYLLAQDPDAASPYENCCCAKGGPGHTYYHGAMRLVQPVAGVTPPAEAIEVFVELPYNCEEPLFV